MKLRIGLFCLLGGLCITVPAMGVGNFGWWWLSGVVTTAALTPIVRYGPKGLWGQFGTIFTVMLVVGMGCTFSESVVFFPATAAQIMTAIPGATVMYLIAAVGLLALGKLLKLTDADAPGIAHRSATTVGPLILASAASYVVYYLIFGAIVFQLFTKQYYPHAEEQVAAMGLWFWGYQLGRGLLMTLAVVPVIYTLRLPRWQAALAVGLMVWVVGGAGPLLVPNTMMVTAQRYLHIGEIFTQNFALGMTAVWLLRPGAVKAAKVGVAVMA
ncbi:MAG: hypothetical protein WBQ94_05120 [Terracidiphilus sp.]